MATRDWPTGPQWEPQTVTWGARIPTSGWAGFYSGQRQRVAHFGHRQVVTLTLPAWRDAVQAAAREAWLVSLQASGDLVRLLPWHRATPLGTIAGSPTVSGSVAAGAASLVLTGARAGVNMLATPSASFEVDTDSNGLADGWASITAGSFGSASYFASTSSPTHGARRQQVTATALGTTASDAVGVFADQAVVEGQTYTFAADFQITAGPACVLAAGIQWRTGGGTFLAASESTVSGTGSVQRVSHTATAPATAATARLILSMSQRSGAAGASTIMLDAACFALGAQAAFPGWATLLPGDFFAAGGQLLQAGPGGATEVAAGTITVPLALPARRAINAGAAVGLVRPTAAFELVQQEPQAAYTPGLVQQPLELTFVEAF